LVVHYIRYFFLLATLAAAAEPTQLAKMLRREKKLTTVFKRASLKGGVSNNKHLILFNIF
jgi:hypothetical protein